MAELFRIRCKQGQLVITEDFIRVELGQLRSTTLMRANFTGIEAKVAVFPIMGMGGGTNLIFHGQGVERLHADLVKPSVAREIVSYLQKPTR